MKPINCENPSGNRGKAAAEMNAINCVTNRQRGDTTGDEQGGGNRAPTGV